jgi:two-component system, NarL family, sensor histidine kinase NreB
MPESSHSGVAAEFRASTRPKARFQPKVETNLYRILQEALNNTHKHANARSVHVTLDSRGDSTVLIISDDGTGFSLRNKARRSKGLGLTGMKERAALIGGTLEMEFARGRGTTIFVSVPTTTRRKRKALSAADDTKWSVACSPHPG